MTNANDVRRAHDILDDISIGNQPNEGNLNHLRSFLPDLPKQKTLEELRREVYDAWAGTNGNEWPDDVHGGLETWLDELHTQLKGLKDTPATVPALPAGMHLADHEEIGRVVASPATDNNGERMIFCLDKTSLTGAGRRWAHEASLTFIDAAPAAPAEPAHPEFLETEADYENAPEGTIVAQPGRLAWVKKGSNAWTLRGGFNGDYSMALSGRRRVWRWGDK